MASAVAYTGGPFPLGYHGLGDVFVMIFFGFVAVCGTAFVQVGTVPYLAALAALPMGSVTTNILVVNNLRDRATDVLAGKRTLAVRWGRRGAELEYIGLYVLAYLTLVWLLVVEGFNPLVLLPVVTIPVAIKNTRGVLRDEGRALNAHLVRSAQLVFFFGVTFALGLFFGSPR
jgi:1,4-dihydroxy-2-naphthoate octaprenyltransferase